MQQVVTLDLLASEAAAAALSEQLHDTLVQDLLATRFLADLVRSGVAKAFDSAGMALPPTLAGMLDELSGVAVSASGQGRAHMNAVKPRCLDGRDLPAALELLGEAVTCTGDLAELSPESAVLAYRLAQAWVADGCPSVAVTREGASVVLEPAPSTPGRRSAVWEAAAAGLLPQARPGTISIPASIEADHTAAQQKEHQ